MVVSLHCTSTPGYFGGAGTRASVLLSSPGDSNVQTRRENGTVRVHSLIQI